MIPFFSLERAALEQKIKDCPGTVLLNITVGGHPRMARCRSPLIGRQPHNIHHVLVPSRRGRDADVAAAVEAARRRAGWRELSFDYRGAASFLKAPALLPALASDDHASTCWSIPSRPTRPRSTPHAADSTFCVSTSTTRGRLLAEHPISRRAAGTGLEFPPLEVFVDGHTAFQLHLDRRNPTTPLLSGHFVICEPSETHHAVARHYLMLLRVSRPACRRASQPGHRQRPAWSGRAAAPGPGRHPLHRSTGTFQHLWRTWGITSPATGATPAWSARPVGNDFVSPHPSSDPACSPPRRWSLRVRVQGHKCSPRPRPTSRARMTRWCGLPARQRES